MSAPTARGDSGRFATALVCALLVAAGGIAWWIQLRPPLEPDVRALAALPHRIGTWQSVDEPLAAAVEAELRADLNLQRVYAGRDGVPIWLYLGYYGTARGGRPEHTPRGCYTGAGWSVLASRRLVADPASGRRVNEYLVERDGARQLVHYWYRSHRETGLLGGMDQNLDRLFGRLGDGRADGALVRLSAEVTDGDEVEARGRLLAFGATIDPLLGERWPDEAPAGTAAARAAAGATSAAEREPGAEGSPRARPRWEGAGG